MMMVDDDDDDDDDDVLRRCLLAPATWRGVVPGELSHELTKNTGPKLQVICFTLYTQQQVYPSR